MNPTKIIFGFSRLNLKNDFCFTLMHTDMTFRLANIILFNPLNLPHITNQGETWFKKKKKKITKNPIPTSYIYDIWQFV